MVGIEPYSHACLRLMLVPVGLFSQLTRPLSGSYPRSADELHLQLPVVAGLPVPRLDFRSFKPSENGCLSSAKHTSRMPEDDPLPDLNGLPHCAPGQPIKANPGC